MFKQLDVAIAVVVVLLGISLLVTILMQIVSALLNLRGKHLEAGLIALLASVEPTLKDHAGTIVRQIVTHPLVSDSIFSEHSPVRGTAVIPAQLRTLFQRATAIRLDEFKVLLYGLASSPGSEPWRTALRDALGADPNNLLARSQVVVDDLAKGLPTTAAERLRAHAHTLAAGVAGTEAKIDAWFEAAMNRVSQRFTLNVRMWTAILGIIVAVMMHFDAIDLYNRVSADESLREKLVKLADQMSPPPAAADIPTLQRSAADIRQRLSVAEYQMAVPTFAEQKAFFADVSNRGGELLGILIGAALLSLGSPFWFNALKGMLSLKTSVASAIDEEQKSKARAAKHAATV